MSYLHYKAINWNEIEDHLDHSTWEKLTSLFWLDTRIPVTNEKSQWEALPENEREAFMKSLAGLASAATFQSEKGYLVINEGKHTQQEAAIYNNIQFIESVHAKAYNTILIGFNEPKEVDDLLTWADNNRELQYRLDRILEVYKTGTPLQKRVANLLLEGVLTYSGFFTPLLYWAQKRFTSVSEMIKLVLTNESLHCFYISHKFQLGFSELTQQEQAELRDWTFDLFVELVNNELNSIEQIYYKTDWLEEAKDFVRQQANNALKSLGFEPLYPESVANSIYIDSINTILTKLTHHDVSSQTNISFQIDKENLMTEEDYDF